MRDVVAEGRASGATYRDKVQTVLQSSYSHHYRRMVPQILSVLTLRATNAQHQPMLEASSSSASMPAGNNASMMPRRRSLMA